VKKYARWNFITSKLTWTALRVTYFSMDVFVLAFVWSHVLISMHYAMGVALVEDGKSNNEAWKLSSRARVNWQPPMHQLPILSTGWAAFFHSTSDGVHPSPFCFVANHCTLFFWFVFCCFFLDLTSHVVTLLTFLPS